MKAAFVMYQKSLHKKLFVMISLCCFLMALSSLPVQAEYLNDLAVGDARALSLGFAVTADPVGISAVHFNPAGLALLKEKHRQLSLGVHSFELQDRVGEQLVDALTRTIYSNVNNGDEFPADPASETSSSTSTNLYTFPSFGVSTASNLSLPFFGMSVNSSGSKSTFATAVYSPQAYGYRRQADSAARYQGDELAVTRLTFLSPSLAFDINNKLKIGFGLNFSWQGFDWTTQLRTPQFLLQELLEIQSGENLAENLALDAFSPYSDIGQMQLSLSSNVSSQVNFGVLYKPTDWISLGATYHSEVSTVLSGRYAFVYSDAYLNALGEAEDSSSRLLRRERVNSGNVDMRYVLPKRINLGVSLIVTDKLKVNLDVKKAFYGALKTLDFSFNNRVDFLAINSILDPASVGPQSLVLSRDLINQISWSIGFEYTLNDRWTLRSGYQLRTRVVPKDKVDFIIPVGESDLLSAGFSYGKNESNRFDFAYAFMQTSIEADAGGSDNANSNNALDVIYNPYPFTSIQSETKSHTLQLSWLKSY